MISITDVTQLILKRASLSRSSGTWSDEEYDVLADGKVVGRILEEGSAHAPPELRWFCPSHRCSLSDGERPKNGSRSVLMCEVTSSWLVAASGFGPCSGSYSPESLCSSRCQRQRNCTLFKAR
jgi:hypothetical protein